MNIEKIIKYVRRGRAKAGAVAQAGSRLHRRLAICAPSGISDFRFAIDARPDLIGHHKICSVILIVMIAVAEAIVSGFARFSFGGVLFFDSPSPVNRAQIV